MLITPDQIRAARALKGWSQGELAERTGLAVPTIANIEISKQSASAKTLEKIITAFDQAGVEFIGSSGVQKRRQNIRVFRGQAEFRLFYEEIYDALKSNNDDVLVGNVDEREFVRYLDEDILILHVKRMHEVKAHYKILICEGDDYLPVSTYAEYRWQNKEDFSSIPFYVFADKLAIIMWLDEPLVFLIDDKKSADVYREKFMEQWQNAKKPPKGSDIITSYMPGDKEKILAKKSKKKAGK